MRNIVNALILVAGLVWLTTITVVTCFDTGYLSAECNGAKDVLESFRLESSTGIVYNNNMDCTYTISAPAGEQILVLFRQFELEAAYNGTCTDYVNFYDGDSTSVAVLNAQPLCADVPPNNVTSSSNVMTLHLVTDESGILRGFELLFVTFNNGPCDSSEFSCSTNICIQPSGRCDGFDHCGDTSDEIGCSAAASTSENNYTGLIVGMVILFVILALVTIVSGVYSYRQWKIRKILKEFQSLREINIKDPQPSYPITEQYTKRQFKLKSYSGIDNGTGSTEQDFSLPTSRVTMSSDSLRTPDFT